MTSVFCERGVGAAEMWLSWSKRSINLSTSTSRYYLQCDLVPEPLPVPVPIPEPVQAPKQIPKPVSAPVYPGIAMYPGASSDLTKVNQITVFFCSRRQ